MFCTCLYASETLNIQLFDITLEPGCGGAQPPLSAAAKVLAALQTICRILIYDLTNESDPSRKDHQFSLLKI